MSWFSLRRRGRPQDDTNAVLRGPQDDSPLTDERLIARRTKWFETYTSQTNVFAPQSGGPYSCPCCGHVTLAERGGYEICGECGWEDDGQDDHNAHVVRDGPNGPQSLASARAAYVREGGTPIPHLPPTEPA